MTEKDLKQPAAEPAEREEAAGDPGDAYIMDGETWDADQLKINGEPISSAYIDLIKQEIERDPDLKQRLKAELSKQYAVLDRVKEEIANMTKSFSDLINQRFTPEQLEQLRQLSESLQDVRLLYDEKLEPYIRAELKKEEYGGLTFEQFLEQYTIRELRDQLRDPDSLPAKLLAAAQATAANAVQTTIKRANIVEYPLDKPNSEIWNLLETDTGGQLKIRFNMLPKKPNLQATAIYAIDFDNLSNELQITKRLQPFDKRVYIATSALFNAGNEIVTLSQIYYAMGYTGRPGAKDLNRISDALTKMTSARILFDNAAEAKALKDYPHFIYDGSLLPFERKTAIVNGQISEGAIRLFREPPLMSFAKQRQQVTTIDVKLLQSPVSKTDANLLIDDYLIERISKAKNGKSNSCRILYKTLYDRAQIKSAKQRQRAPEKVKKYLQYYQQAGFIKKYTTQEDGITVYF